MLMSIARVVFRQQMLAALALLLGFGCVAMGEPMFATSFISIGAAWGTASASREDKKETP
jgi:hypothetical protein